MLDSPAVLISVKPKWALAIAARKKTVELRRRFPNLPKGARVVVYATLPVGMVLGIAIVDRVVRATPGKLWRDHGEASAVPEDLFEAYFEGCEEGCAVVFSEFWPVRQVSLSKIGGHSSKLRAPQSYRYLSNDVLERIEALTVPFTG